MSNQNVAAIIGVGPVRGLGGQLAKRFAKTHRVYIAGRNAESLNAVAAELSQDGSEIQAVPTDARNEDAVKQFLDLASADSYVDLAIYNVGNNTPGKIADMDPGYFEYSWRTCCFGGFLFAKEAINRMTNGGTILFTGASASMRGRANFGAFNSSKAALRNMAQALAKEVGPEGIHVGHVVVDGAIAGDKIIQGLPDLAKRMGSDGMVNLEGIVDIYEMLYNQPRNAWSFEVDVRTSLESW